MEHSQELAQQIRARIGELEADLEAHRRALAVLEQRQSSTQPSPNGSRRSRARRPRATTARATAEVSSTASSAPSGSRAHRRPAVSTEAVFDALTDGNDQAAAIAQEFGVSTAVVRHRLEQLEEAGRVSRSGQRRGTRWRSHAAN